MSSLNLLPVCPWFVPVAPASLRLGVEALRSEIELYAPRQIVQREEEPYSEIRVVHSGLLSQAVINRRLSKPLAMNLYAESSMMGFLNLFTGVQAPRLVTCEKRAKATVVNRQLVLAAVKTNSQFLLEFSAYCEIAAKSELIGMEALFSLPLEERLQLFYAAALLRSGAHPLESSAEYLRMPYPITRAALERVIYVSRASLDRLLAAASKSGMILLQGGERFVRRRDIAAMTEWILER